MHSQPDRHPVHVLADLHRRKRKIERRIQELREERETIKATLSLFIGRCRHRWVGSSSGSFGCPLCNDHDGDHHLVSMDAIAVQPEDWGHAWGSLLDLGSKRLAAASASE
jgi:hypothetical protein